MTDVLARATAAVRVAAERAFTLPEIPAAVPVEFEDPEAVLSRVFAAVLPGQDALPGPDRWRPSGGTGTPVPPPGGAGGPWKGGGPPAPAGVGTGAGDRGAVAPVAPAAPVAPVAEVTHLNTLATSTHLLRAANAAPEPATTARPAGEGARYIDVHYGAALPAPAAADGPAAHAPVEAPSFPPVSAAAPIEPAAAEAPAVPVRLAAPESAMEDGSGRRPGGAFVPSGDATSLVVDAVYERLLEELELAVWRAYGGGE